MNAAMPVSPIGLLRRLYRHRELLATLVRSDLRDQYRGSVAGLAWALLVPTLMLAAYTLVFGYVFRSRWPGSTGGATEVALHLFAGLLLHALLSETLSRAPTLVVKNASLVKRVSFPLELLPLVNTLGVLLHVLLQYLVWAAAVLLFADAPTWGLLLAPLMLLPVALVAAGLSWWLSSTAVLLRDTVHFAPVVSALLVFLAPVFYPLEAVPEAWRNAMLCNPLSFPIEQFRALALHGATPDWTGWGVYGLFAGAAAWAGYAWFQRLRPELPDAL